MYRADNNLFRRQHVHQQANSGHIRHSIQRTYFVEMNLVHRAAVGSAFCLRNGVVNLQRLLLYLRGQSGFLNGMFHPGHGGVMMVLMAMVVFMGMVVTVLVHMVMTMLMMIVVILMFMFVIMFMRMLVYVIVIMGMLMVMMVVVFMRMLVGMVMNGRSCMHLRMNRAMVVAVLLFPVHQNLHMQALHTALLRRGCLDLDPGQQPVHLLQKCLLLLRAQQIQQRSGEHIARRAHGTFDV